MEFTDREKALLVNSLHERAMRLLDISNAMSQKTYRFENGIEPTKDDIDHVFNGHKEHLRLIDKIREINLEE